MRNKFLNKKNKSIKIRAFGNPTTFINQCIRNDVFIINTSLEDDDTLTTTIFLKDLNKVRRFKNTKIRILRRVGVYKTLNTFSTNKFLVGSLIMSYFIVVILSNIIFDVLVIHDNMELKMYVNEKLEEYGVKDYTIRKSYERLEEIEKAILKDSPNKLEWIEISRIGTNYIVKLQEKKLNRRPVDNTPQHIVSSEKGVVKRIYASSGEVLIHNDDYVTDGQILISGLISHGEKSKYVHADGIVYAETWKNIKVTQDLNEIVKQETGRTKKKFGIIFFNRFFKKDTYEFSEVKINKIYSSRFLPFEICYFEDKEVVITERSLSYVDAIIFAEQKGEAFIRSKLDEDEYIIDKKTLNIKKVGSKIEIDVLYVVYEKISEEFKINIEQEY